MFKVRCMKSCLLLSQTIAPRVIFEQCILSSAAVSLMQHTCARKRPLPLLPADHHRSSKSFQIVGGLSGTDFGGTRGEEEVLLSMQNTTHKAVDNSHLSSERCPLVRRTSAC